MTKTFISKGIIKEKIPGTENYKILLENNTYKMISSSKIKGVPNIDSKGSLFRIMSDRLYYYLFEID